MDAADAINFYLGALDAERQKTTSLALQLQAAKTVLTDRERELLELKGPCSHTNCRLHYAHSGPCDCQPNTTNANAIAPGREAVGFAGARGEDSTAENFMPRVWLGGMR